jgi:hypothetical protein
MHLTSDGLEGSLHTARVKYGKILFKHCSGASSQRHEPTTQPTAHVPVLFRLNIAGHSASWRPRHMNMVVNASGVDDTCVSCSATSDTPGAAGRVEQWLRLVKQQIGLNSA